MATQYISNDFNLLCNYFGILVCKIVVIEITYQWNCIANAVTGNDHCNVTRTVQSAIGLWAKIRVRTM